MLQEEQVAGVLWVWLACVPGSVAAVAGAEQLTGEGAPDRSTQQQVC